MKTHYATAAKSIKAELTKAFPGIKFSVSSKGFSMGNSVRVSWEAGPTVEQVNRIAGRYQEGHFNGMEDIYEYDHNRPTTNGSAKWVNTERHFSEETYKTVIRSMCELLGVEYQEPYYDLHILNERACTIFHRVLYNMPIPAGYEITGAKRTSVTCGLLEEFYEVTTAKVVPSC